MARDADPTRVGRYEVLRELGRGGMATVHLARQLDLDRLVALKRLDGLAEESDVRVRRFVREARFAASLSHPNIVTVHDAFEADGVPYIAMELVPGGTLRELLTGLTLGQVAGVLDGVLAGLEHAERRHIVHRDLKPENLMVTAEGGIKITDFGIAKATSVAHGDDGPLTTAGVAIGTPAYMAPEQALAEEAGPRTDLYAVGVIAFEMLTGHVPFEDREAPVRVLMQHVSETPPLVAELRPGVDPQLSQWVAALLAKAPSDRPASAVAAREALEDIVLRLRGGRWRRETPLPFLAGAAPAPTASLPSPAGRAAAASAPPAADSLLSDDRTRAARRTPPAPPVRDDTAALASPRGARRVPRAVTMALVAGVAAAAIAAGSERGRRRRARRSRPGRAGVPGGVGGGTGCQSRPGGGEPGRDARRGHGGPGHDRPLARRGRRAPVPPVRGGGAGHRGRRRRDADPATARHPVRLPRRRGRRRGGRRRPLHRNAREGRRARENRSRPPRR